MCSSSLGISKTWSYVPLREKKGLATLNFSWKKIFDPEDDVLEVWNKMFVVCCVLGVSCDPLLFYVLYIDDKNACIDIETDVAMVATMLRTILDAFYCVRIFFKARTKFVTSSSQVTHSGQLETNSAQRTRHYFKGIFILDILSVIPLPQVTIWHYFLSHAGARRTKEALLFTVLVQYIPRFFRISPLAFELERTSGFFVQSVFYGVIYYLMLFVLLGHILGSAWYLLALRRNIVCWEKACASSNICDLLYLQCSNYYNKRPIPIIWSNTSKVFFQNACSMKNDDILSLDVVKFGIFKQALESDIFSKDNFSSKFVYCVWWGLQNLSTLGQGLEPSMDPGEITFTISLAVFGIVLFGLLIGNVQIYLQSLTLKMDETRLQRLSAEEWMQHRVVPRDLMERFRRYEQYRWLETGGVDEESLVQSLSADLRKDIKRHICLPLVKRVPIFSTMDYQLLHAFCERLKPSFYIESTCIVHQGDPVEELLIIVRGQVESVTTNGVEGGLYNLCVLREGDFCGDELLAWSLEPRSDSTLPLSTQRMQALTEVEAFVLSSEDIKSVSSQFRNLYSRQFQHIFRFYSQQWRQWAASCIQSAWLRHTIREKMNVYKGPLSFGAIMYASQFAAIVLCGLQRTRNTGYMVELQKPPAPESNMKD